MKVVSDVFSEYLQEFNEADSLYDSLSQQVSDFALLGVLDDEDWDSLKARLSKAKETREHYAVVLCRVLSDYNFFESDAPEDAPADASEVAPADVPADVPEDVPEADPDSPTDASEVAPADVPEDVPEADPDSPTDALDDIFPAMSAKCKLCPSCVDGRCFFVPDIYDSEFPCQSSAWDNFFKSGGSHGPAP